MQEGSIDTQILPKKTVEVQEFTGQTMEGSNRYGLFKEQVKPKIDTSTEIQIDPIVTPQIVKEKVVIDPVVIR